MVGVGGLFVMGGGYLPGTIPQALGALSVLLASVNVAGGNVNFPTASTMLTVSPGFIITKVTSLPNTIAFIFIAIPANA